MTVRLIGLDRFFHLMTCSSVLRNLLFFTSSGQRKKGSIPLPSQPHSVQKASEQHLRHSVQRLVLVQCRLSLDRRRLLPQLEESLVRHPHQ